MVLKDEDSPLAIWEGDALKCSLSVPIISLSVSPITSGDVDSNPMPPVAGDVGRRGTIGPLPQERVSARWMKEGVVATIIQRAAERRNA